MRLMLNPLGALLHFLPCHQMGTAGEGHGEAGGEGGGGGGGGVAYMGNTLVKQ